MRSVCLSVLLLAQLAAAAFYLPGVAPRSFGRDDSVPLQVNKLTSTKTQLPYEYYDVYGTRGCKPASRRQESHNLGSVLAGDAIETSKYKLLMRRPTVCQVACRTELKKKEVKRFQEMIDDEYHVHWIVDNLPAAMRLEDPQNPTVPYYARGFPVGFTLTGEDGKPSYYLNNHIVITIRHHEDPQFSGSRIVGFEVEPFSVDHEYDDEEFDAATTVLSTCNSLNLVGPSSDSLYERLDARNGGEVIFTYDVGYVASDTPWANRWDVYLRGNPDDHVHWFSIVNSLLIVVFLAGMVSLVLLRTLHRDIAAYNEVADDQEETGWKLLHADVFRPPQQAMLFSVLCGTGTQVVAMTVTTMTFALLGFLSPANRGGLLTALLLLFVFMGSAAGYNSARLYKTFGGKEWKQNTLLTAFAYPGAMFTIFFVLNLFDWYEGSSNAVPLGTLFALLVLWFGISVPLVFLGSYFGFKKDGYELPTRTNQIERQVPEQLWYMQPTVTILLGGVLPFAAVSIELFFIMSALWLHQIYYLFGFLVAVLVILALTCGLICVTLTYFTLCSENYHWWWRSFLSAASSALYLLFYAVWYYETSLEIEAFSSSMLYFGYMLIISLTFAILTGAIGFYSTFWFVRAIYGSVKVD